VHEVEDWQLFVRSDKIQAPVSLLISFS